MPLLHTSLPDTAWPSWLNSRWPIWNELVRDAAMDAEIRVEEYEEDGAWVVRAEVPGIDPERDVEVTVRDSVLSISVQRRSEQRSGGSTRRRSEFSYGSFTRTLSLPVAANADKVTASYEDGILEVRVPLDGERAGVRRIEVRSRS
jgi:HSP20 family protein